MKLTRILFLVVALGSVGSLAGCSGSDGEIAIDAATTPLTADGNDTLFTVRLVEARADGYALDGIVVKVLPDGKEPLVLSCSAADANDNQKLEKGESLTCKEGATNELGPDLGGKELEVEVHATIDGSETKVGSASWTVAK